MFPSPSWRALLASARHRCLSTSPFLPSTYMRELPSSCLVWDSVEGRARCSEALAAGTLESHFLLSPHFRTQSEPIACGQSTLAMVLNALEGGGGGAYGAAPLYQESALDCCHPREEVAARGLTLGTLACMARCCGFGVGVTRVAPLPDVGPPTAAAEALAAGQLAALRGALRAAASAPGAGHCALVAAYSREALGQTGALGRAAVGVHSGHYSPLGGYHAPSDSALIMDVARFKYPPHWVALPDLFQAMRYPDPETRAPRGYMLVTRSPLTLALQGALGGGTQGSVLRALFGPSAVDSSSSSAAHSTEAAAAAAAAEAARLGLRCGGQGRVGGAAVAVLRRVWGGEAAAAGGGVQALVRALHREWEKEEAVHAQAEYRLHEHPTWGGGPLSQQHARLAGGVLAQLQGTPLFEAVRQAVAGQALGRGAPVGQLAWGSQGQHATLEHRLTLLLGLGIVERGGQGMQLLQGLPKELVEEFRGFWGLGALPCEGCGTD